MADNVQNTNGEPQDIGAQDAPKTYDEDYVKKIRGEAASWRTKYREADESITALTAEVEGLRAKAEGADSANATLAEKDKTIARLKVALDKGLPADLAARLQGETEEEIAADADSLLSLLGEKETPPVDLDQGARGDGNPTVSMNDALRGLLRGR